MDSPNDNDVSMGDLPDTGVSADNVDNGVESGDIVFFTECENAAEHNVDVNHERDGDVAMDDNAEPEHPDVVEIKAFHRNAEEKLAIKTYKINKEITLLPSLHRIYFHPDEAVVPQAPPFLQLTNFFLLYNDIAKANFLADKSLPLMVNQAMFFYGLDRGHSFSRFFDQIRYNIVLMAFAWASDFDPRYCREGCKEFVRAFFRAWIESQVFEYDPEANNFERREAFIALWQNSPFDFHFFSARRAKTVAKVLKVLANQVELLPNLPTPANFIQAARCGELSEDIFDKFGAAMTLQWLMGLRAKNEERQRQIDEEEEYDQAGLELKRAKAHKGYVEAARHFGYLSMDYQPADEFDPFEENALIHPGMSKIDRDEQLLSALLLPIDDYLEHPSKVSDKKDRVVDETSFWVSHAQVQAILKEDVPKQEYSRLMAEMTVLLNTTVIEPTEE